MKRVFRTIAIIVIIILAVLAIAYAYINLKGIPSYETVPEEVVYEHTTDSLSLERGKKLVAMLCASCHMNPKKGNLTGKYMADVPKEFGEIYSVNITNDPEYGIGDWTDAELLYLLRTGIKRDGKYTPPYMAKLPNMADEDINAIISFLRSDHPMVAADPTPDQQPKPSFLVKFLSQTVFKPYEMPEESIPMPNATNSIELGKYYAVNLDCFSCHSEDFKTNDYLNPEKSTGYFGGGNKILNNEGEVIHSTNLTPDKKTGIGNWTKEQFVQAVRFGKMEGEPDLRYPMIQYALLTDEEAGAIYEYLQTIPAINNQVDRFPEE